MAKPVRVKPKTREEWIALRRNGIGGSDAAVILGLSPWKNANELWAEKTGSVHPKDISDDPFVQKGVRLEPALRNLFMAIHPEYKVYHEQFDMWSQKDRPWAYSTLDGRIKTPDGKMGVLEIKTATPSGKAGWEKWQGQVPQNYFTQICHQLSCTGYDFAILFACLFNSEGDFTAREYKFNREDLEEDIKYLTIKEDEFWRTVQNKTLPPMTLII